MMRYFSYERWYKRFYIRVDNPFGSYFLLGVGLRWGTNNPYHDGLDRSVILYLGVIHVHIGYFISKLDLFRAAQNPKLV